MADANWVREYQDGEIVAGTPYRVIRLLGAGGMGSVYEVEHIELGRHYVLKSLLRTLASRQDLIARMRNEWRALGRLRHPNIVDVINAGTTSSDVPYYVMELLQGETVRERLARVGKVPIGEAVRIAQATLLGLAAAHAIGVIHRDIKPANIFLTKEGAVKVLDFGIAQTRMMGMPKITAQGLAIGTPRYMSPEQASGEKADARSDVYATGLLLFEMMAGHGPFDDLGDSTQQMLAHLHRPARPLSELIELPAELEALIARALAKAPRERPRSAQYMAAELAPFAALAVSAPPRLLGSSRPPMSTSPTPPAVVLGVDALPEEAGTPIQNVSGVLLDSEWEQPTKEPPSVPAPTLERVPSVRPPEPAPVAARENSPMRRVVNAAPLAAAVAVGLVVGVAVVAFGAAHRPTLDRPAAAAAALTAPMAAPRAVSSASVAHTEAALQAASVSSEAPPRPTEPATHKGRKRPSVPANETMGPGAHATTEADGTRLPPSGL